MPRRLDLNHWTHEHEAEIVFHRGPVKHTGIMVRAYGGWKWKTKEGRAYRTNGKGRGLWFWMENLQEWKHLQYTWRFSLPEDRGKTIKQLRRLGYDLATEQS